MVKLQQKVRIRIFVFDESMELKVSWRTSTSRKYFICSTCRKKISPGSRVVMEEFKDHGLYYHRGCFYDPKSSIHVSSCC